MDDKIYKILNDAKQDISGLNSKALSDKEVNSIMEKFHIETNKNNTPNKRKIKKSVVIAAVAAAIVVCGGTAAAAGYMNVFNRAAHKNDTTFTLTFPDSEETTELPLDKFAVRYNYNDIADAAKESKEKSTAETDNFNLQIESIYCDGSTLMIGISGSMKDGNPQHKQLINFYPLKINIGSKTYSSLSYGTSNEFAYLDGSLVLDEGSDNQFSGDITLILFGDEEIKEPADADITIYDIKAQENYMDENYTELGKNVKLSANISPDTFLRSSKPYTISEDGYSVRFYEISPAMMVIGFSSPDPNSSSWLNYENGSQVEHIGTSAFPDYGDDFSIGCMVPVTSGYVTASFFNKNNIDENGNIINTKEIKINMDEVISHLKK